MARIARQVLPFLPLMRDAEAQVARLAEMHADDAATRASDPRLLATAPGVLAPRRAPLAKRGQPPPPPPPGPAGRERGEGGPPSPGPRGAIGPRPPAAAPHH